MNNHDLIKLLHNADACKPAMLKARGLSIEGLLKLYIDNIDFTLTHPMLGASFLRSHATESQLNSAGIYINSTGIIKTGEVAVFINSNVRILKSGYEVSRIYLLNSNLTMDATEQSISVVDLYGISRAIIHNHSATASVNVNPGSTVETVGYVRINRK